MLTIIQLHLTSVRKVRDIAKFLVIVSGKRITVMEITKTVLFTHTSTAYIKPVSSKYHVAQKPLFRWKREACFFMVLLSFVFLFLLVSFIFLLHIYFILCFNLFLHILSCFFIFLYFLPFSRWIFVIPYSYRVWKKYLSHNKKASFC